MEVVCVAGKSTWEEPSWLTRAQLSGGHGDTTSCERHGMALEDDVEGAFVPQDPS